MPHAIRIHQTGGPEVLRWESVEQPEPGPGQIRLRQTAIGLNYIDIYQRIGLYKLPLPATLGMEGAGIVDALGPDVTEFSLGDRVAYAGPLGGYAEFRLIGADQLVKLPNSISDNTAAAMMLQGITAQYLLRQVYRVKAGETVLIHAAAGGVGLIFCQWAAALGATVIGTVSTAEKADLAAAHGCHHPIITSREDFLARVIEITKGQKLPVIYDSIGRDTFLKSLDCLQPRGLMVSFGQSSGAVEPLDLSLLSAKGSLSVTRPTMFTFISSRAGLLNCVGELFEMVGSGQIKIPVHQHYPLQDAAEAHRALEGRRTTGATVLTVG